MTTPRLLPLVVAVAATALLTPAGALAKGGDRPAPTPAPAPAPVVAPVTCDPSADGPTADGLGFTFSSDVWFSSAEDSAGCLRLVATGSAVRFVSMQLTPGFTYELLSDSHTANGVTIRFTRTRTGERREWRVEPGKTVIK